MSYYFKKIHHVQLAAPKGCEDEARKFFGDILGLEEIEKPENLKKRGGVWFALGSYQIHIGVEEPFAPAKKAHPAFEVENLPALMEHLKNHNIDVMEDHELPFANRFYAYDPFGNRLEFLEMKK
jgi:catechol 2,3-dioxygenase-like lactoylglutathione lyase family enzyme